jgi:hypothetical protein
LVEERHSDSRTNFLDSTLTQHGSSVSAGGGLTVNSGGDVTVVASKLEAKGDVTMDAKGDLLFASAADEQHSYFKDKKETRQQDHVNQIGTTLEAGGKLTLKSGKDMTLIASDISAGKEAYLHADGDLQLLAAQDKDYTLYDMKKSGSWGSKKTQHDEVTQITHIGTQIKSGGDLTLFSGGDQRYQVAKLNSDRDIILDSGGAIVFEGVKDLHDESHIKSDGDAFWTSSKGKGNTDETLRQTQMIAKGNITIKAVEGLRIDLKQVNQQTVSQTIDAMVKADPQLAWLKQAEARGDVDWRQVKEIHESFKYSNSGLGPASQLIIAIALAAVMGPMMVGMNAMVQAGALSVATKATVSTIDNRGNLGKVIKDVTSKDSIKGYVVAAATAGVTDGLNYNPGKIGLDVKSLNTVAIKVTADAVIKTAVYGGSFKDNLASSAVSVAAGIGGAVGAGKIGDLPLPEGGLAKIVLHAGLGGLLAEAMGGDFRTGALAGGANEVLVGLLGDKLLPSNLVPGSAEYNQAQANLLALSQIVGVLGAAASGGDVEVGAAVAANATQYNYQAHWSDFEKSTDGCRKNPSSTGCSTILGMAGVTAQPLENGLVQNLDESGNAVSYTILGENGKPLLIMEPKEYELYRQLPVAWQEGYLTVPAWKLNLASSILRTQSGEIASGVDHYGYMLSEPEYWVDLIVATALSYAAELLPLVAGAKGIEVAPGKFDYLFGRVASNSHNAARSNQLALEMKRLGVPDNAAGRQMLTEHLTASAKTEGNIINTFSNQYGKFEVRESLFMGPSGKAANFQSTFQVLDDGTRKLSTLIPLH